MEPATVTNSFMKLNDGNSIPVLGLGVYQTPPGDVTYEAVKEALQAGYRHIDSAAFYGNEADVGRAVRDSGLPREDLFITTKLWSMDLRGDGYDYAIKKAENSLKQLGTYIDLYLVHSPHHPKERLNIWRALEDLKQSGKVRSIGVSNYGIHHLEELLNLKTTRVVPAVNQVELHPFLQREKLVEFCFSKGICVQAYSPLAKAKRMNHPTLLELERKYKKTPAQLMIRWGLQKGYVSLPKSQRAERIRENSSIFDFEISEEDMKVLDLLDIQLTTGWDPTKMK